ncbi:carbon starvation protein A [Brevibacillus sp. SYP-B805]|uniref:carbon starvation CstA family protein n=1 Tax=Brevibacillus sp. SYP-B805 TaxID=1578199 RepID=UPI0013EB3ED3|nr:carbon starvation CstA family protein [Brevibacillus sp. SYP-B805]NGQ96855.1 carbon starvation protein A [Brevibacillus sp. SYP-B805]
MQKWFLSAIIWGGIAALGAVGFGTLALSRGESVNSFWLLTAAFCTYAVAYRFYSRFIANKVMGLDDNRATPAEVNNDGKDFVPTNKWIVFGHHFAAIAGAGPLVGPTLAAQMGYLPGTIWIIVGVVLGGAVQDFVILFGSMRRNGKTLGQIAKEEIGPVGGFLALIGILAIMVILIAVLAMVVVNALADSPWATFTIFMTLPIAILMGLYMRYIRPGRVLEGSLIGLVLLFVALWWGQAVAESPTWGPAFTFTKPQLAWMIIIYGFIASVLPVWLLLAPRDYLSSFLKIGTIAVLAVGIVLTLPPLQMPALTRFIDGTGPVFAGNLFPFLFITIACGAVSGFHALVSSGTTPKLIAKESHAPMIGYGGMLMESAVAIMAMIAACVLTPGMYFAVNSPAAVIGADAAAAAAKITEWGFTVTPDQITAMANDIGEKTILSRTGGAPSLAIGMATIFAGFFGGFKAFWYHFAILFEAVFILTTIDAGTRVGRFMVQDLLGNVIPKMKEVNWLPGNLIGSALITLGWGYFLLQGVYDPLGGIFTLWPLFGIANQMLAAIAFTVGTTIIFKMGKARYSWVTLVPMAWLSISTLTAAWQKLFHEKASISFLTHAETFKKALAEGTLPPGVKTVEAAQKMILNDQIDAVVCAIFMVITVGIILDGLRLWISILNGKQYELQESPYVQSKGDDYYDPKGHVLA